MKREMPEHMKKKLRASLEEVKEFEKNNIPPTETEGFKSLISKEEYEAILEVHKAFVKLRDINAEGAMNHNADIEEPLAMVQYLAYTEMFKDLDKALCAMYRIHELNKEFFEKEVLKEGETPIMLLMRMTLDNMFS